MTKYLSTAAALAIATALTSPAQAQEQGSTASDAAQTSTQRDASPDEIIVTATKTGAQSLQQTPLAIQAFTGEDLKDQNIQDVSDLVAAIPGASIGQDTTGGIKSFNIRGVGAGGSNGETPIGYYLDEVPFVVTNFGIAPPIKFLDIERVEVLRGPQGTLYGQGSAGGTIIFRTRDPDLNDFQVLGETFISDTRDAAGFNFGLAGALSIPLIPDVLAVRVSGGYSKQQGYADVYFGANDGSPDDTDVNPQMNSDWRIAALFRPASNITIRGQVWQFRPRQGFQSLYNDVDPFFMANSGGIEGFSTGKFTLYSLVGEVDLDSVAITSATSYLEGSFGYRIPLGVLGLPAGTSFDSFFYPKNFNQEVRVRSAGTGPLKWVVGGTYNNGDGPQRNIIDFVVAKTDSSTGTPTKNWAGFGEVSYDLMGGKLVPLVGLRYYHDRRAYEDPTTTLPTTLKKTTWRANLSYLPSDDVTAFVTVSTGFRVNTVQSMIQAQLIEADGLEGKLLLDPLSLRNYELGVKTRLFGNTLYLGANFYRIEYSGLQTGFTTSAGIGGFVNLGDAHSNGVDLSLLWRTPVPGLTLQAVGNYNDSKYDEVDSRITAQRPAVRPGARLLASAKYNYRVDANYEGGLSDSLRFFGNVNFSRTGDRPTISGVVAPAYNLLGATLGLRRGPYEFALFGENLTDDRGPTDFFTPLAMAGLTPRTAGVRLRKMF